MLEKLKLLGLAAIISVMGAACLYKDYFTKISIIAA